MEDKNIIIARRVAEAVREASGRTFYVGGYVRDRLLGRENKDIDIEVQAFRCRRWRPSWTAWVSA